MENIKARLNSLYFELAGLLLAAVAVSGIFFLLINRAGTSIITERFSDSDHIEKLSGAYIDKLQRYIDENQVMSNDSEKLTAWVKRQKIVSIQVYKNEILTYDSNYPDAAVEDAAAEGEYYEWQDYYTAEFADGTADVFLYGFFSYPLYSYALIAEILLSVVLLITIVILGIRSRVKYIGKLKEECEILGSGNLDYQVTVQGKDELAMLAVGLDSMRAALKESNDKEAELTLANRRMITEMSHDLRTPLTSLLIYTEILEKKDIRDAGQLREYIQKIERKAQQIKRLSDNIFEYALVTEGTEVELGEPETLRDIFYDPLSEMTAYLGEQAYSVEIELERDGRKIRINEEYINRILDNLVSNIIKYADKKSPVKIGTVYNDESGGLRFENRICEDAEDKKRTEGSTNIGLRNVEKMMKSMHGSCTAEQKEDTFVVTLMFPWTDGTGPSLSLGQKMCSYPLFPASGVLFFCRYRRHSLSGFRWIRRPCGMAR